jgi:hypothetical protein
MYNADNNFTIWGLTMYISVLNIIHTQTLIVDEPCQNIIVYKNTNNQELQFWYVS